MKLTKEEISKARFCVRAALEEGADQARALLTKSVSDSVTVLNGETDNITHSEDRSLSLSIFVDGRFGSCYTNRMDEESLRTLIRKCIATTRYLEKDAFRHLPDPDKCCHDALTGEEMGLCDAKYFDLSAEDKLALALAGGVWGTDPRIAAEETNYGDSLDDCFLVDSNGTEARHTETCFCFSTEVTVSGDNGRKYRDWWSETSPFLDKVAVAFGGCPRRALERALAKAGSSRTRSGLRTVIVENRVASKLLSPVMDALNTYATDQKQSFLCDCLGKKVFSEKMSLHDYARVAGRAGAALFDDEGLATENRPFIEGGTIRNYFTDGYMSAKTGAPLTISEASVPTLLPTTSDTLEELVASLHSGILITGFLGGNCNPATGDFSYGIEGFVVRDGKRVHPFSDAIVTGNFLEFWNSLEAVGSDPREGMSWQIPSLLFSSVRINA